MTGSEYRTTIRLWKVRQASFAKRIKQLPQRLGCREHTMKGGIVINKRCTNSSCRKVFSTLQFGSICPHCLKKYPQLNTKLATKTLVSLQVIEYKSKLALSAIKLLRSLTAQTKEPLSLREARDAVVGHYTITHITHKKAWEIARQMGKVGARIRIF